MKVHGILLVLILLTSCVTLEREPVLTLHETNQIQSTIAASVVLADQSMHQDALNLVWQPKYQLPLDRDNTLRVSPLSEGNELVQGSLYVHEDTAYFAFTGTHTLRALVATVAGMPLRWNGQQGVVHGGVLKPFEAWVGSGEVDRLLTIVRELGAHSFVLVGYSQGGGLAVMLARWLKEARDVPSTVVTLNAIRPFQADFVSEYQTLGLPTVNFIYRNDPVSEFPLGREWLLPGRTLVLDGPRGGLLNIDDHFLDHFFVLVDPDYRFHF